MPTFEFLKTTSSKCHFLHCDFLVPAVFLKTLVSQNGDVVSPLYCSWERNAQVNDKTKKADIHGSAN